jgi:hypothetical protein
MNTQSLARYSQPLMVAGVILLLIGLAWDAILHWADPDLAAQEGIFTMTNPGHVLFGGGIALAVTGLLLQIAFSPGRSFATRLVPAAGLIALSLLTVGFGASSEGGIGGGGHSHEGDVTHVHEDGMEHDEDEHAEFLAQDDTDPELAAAVGGAMADHHDQGGGEQVSADSSGGEGGIHGAHEEIPLTLAEWDVLSEQVEIARQATEKYRDIDAAYADGYVQITQFIPGIAAHFVKQELLNAPFDPATPSNLLYEPDENGNWVLVGVAYTAPNNGDEIQPDGFAGPLDGWHYHKNLCFKGGGVSIASSAAQCPGGAYVERTQWLLHAWFYKDSPEGMFSHQNSLVS